MSLFAEINVSNALTVGGIVVGAVIAFWLLHKIVKFILSVAIVVLLVAAAVVYCVKAGYISSETAERINPLNNETVSETLKEVGAWVGDKTKSAAKRAITEAVNESFGGGSSANGESR